MKVDVAVQSYKKPETLLYMLMSLKKCSEPHIDTIFINDDSGPDSQVLQEIYTSERVKSYFPQWNIRFRTNTGRVGWWQAIVRNCRPTYMDIGRLLYRGLIHLLKTGRIFTDREDIRYQWAFDSTDKKYLFIVHDDVLFHSDLLGLYLEKAEGMAHPGIVGDLGQCWRCPYSSLIPACSPQRIVDGWRPSSLWPQTGQANNNSKRACRINEWSALVSVEAAKGIIDKDHAFFGNYDDCGDIAAYWFAMALRHGYEFMDPLPEETARSKYYTHGWFGKSGHSVWVDQGQGKNIYDPRLITKKMVEDFGVSLLAGGAHGKV